MRHGALGLAFLVAAASGCAHRAADRIPEPWKFEARATDGEVRVLPLVALHEEPSVELGTFVGVPVPYERQRLREERTRQLNRVPQMLAERLPGAVNGQLGARWDGQFHHGAWPVGGQDRLRSALHGDMMHVDQVLSEVAEGSPSKATLFTWVRDLDGRPVSLDGFPGMLVDTAVGPVHVNHRDEAYVITLRVGMALVTGDGEVVIRYEYDYHTLLSGSLDDAAAGGDLARSMAHDVTKVWAIESELNASTALLAQESW